MRNPNASAPPALETIPVLTEVIAEPRGPAEPLPMARASAGDQGPQDLLGPAPPLDMTALEARLLEGLTERLQATLEHRVHASVAPAVSLLADRIAYKAAQEVAGDLVARMRDDLQQAVRQALQESIGRR